MPSDGGGKAREWTLMVCERCGHLMGPLHLRESCEHRYLPVRVVEKEWADRQLAEALDVIEDYRGGDDQPARRGPDFDAGWLLKRHGRSDDARTR